MAIQNNYKAVYLEGDNFNVFKDLMCNDFVISLEAQNFISQALSLICKYNMIYAS